MFRRVIQPGRRYYRRGPRCPNRCGRHTDGSLCVSCRLARREGYYLSPAPEEGEQSAPGREERIEAYRARAERGLPLFGGEGTGHERPRAERQRQGREAPERSQRPEGETR